MTLNVSIPRFQALLRREYLYNLEEHEGETEPCVVFGVSSVPGRAVGFWVLTENGAVVSRLPVGAIVSKPEAPRLETHVCELWNSFGYGCAVTEFDFLEGMRCRTFLRDGQEYPGSYMFTLDWYGSADAEDVGDLGNKCAHLIELDNGCYALQPNNRILWAEPSFVKPTKERPDYKTMNHIFRCEQHGKWLAGTDDRMFFEVVNG